ncbi:MAG: hypothetical protein K8T10_00455 [Candidatus Eremiobacteraeota bacterium]|nr:hypothetical protein [Candidatus Eremiobacteraeota bacterium]
MINRADRNFAISNTANISIRKAEQKGRKPSVNLSDSVQLSATGSGKIKGDSIGKKASSKTKTTSEKKNKTKTAVGTKTIVKKSNNSDGQTKAIFIEEETPKNPGLTRKRKIIENLIDPAMKPERREKLARKLEKYPETALRIIKDDGAGYSKKKSGFIVTKRLGYYTQEDKTIHLANGTLSDFFHRHKGLANALRGGKSILYAMAGIGAAVASPFVLPAMAAGITAAIVAPIGLSAVPLSWLVSAGESDIPIHETAHALDYALGSRGKFKDMKIDKRYKKSLKNQRRLEDGVLNMPKPAPKLDPAKQPASVKSKEIMDCYEDCKNWQNKDARFLTEYAGTNPKEYFAESVKAYLNTDKSESDICREDLIKKDPKMFSLVDNLFKEINAGVYN